MARMGNGILGVVRGSISDITGINRYGKGIILKKADRSNVVYTLPQKSVQATFRSMTLFGKSIYNDILKISVTGITKRLTKWNWFCKENYVWFGKFGLSSLNAMQLSKGSIDGTVITLMQYNLLHHWIRFVWPIPSFPITPSWYDQANVLSYNINRLEFIHAERVNNRGVGNFTYEYPVYWQVGETIVNYLYFTSLDIGVDASDTVNKSFIL